jgi:hypothetical protein
MPTLNISFNVPDAAVPRLQDLLAQMNNDRVEAGETPYANVNDMAEQILKNRLILLVREAERNEKNAVQQQLKTADLTDQQIEDIKAILGA